MTPEMLIAEGQRLIRPCVFLRPDAPGPVAAVWHARNYDEVKTTGKHCWLTVDTSFVPGFPVGGSRYMSVLTDEAKCEGGFIEYSERKPVRDGIELRSFPESILPPIEVIFMKGSDVVAKWLASHDWPRHERYNDNFPDRHIVAPYEKQWMMNYPLYRQDGTYAVLGGWHWPCADDDWYRLIDEQLMVLTIEGSEPWVEAWRLRSGTDKVVQRIT